MRFSKRAPSLSAVQRHLRHLRYFLVNAWDVSGRDKSRSLAFARDDGYGRPRQRCYEPVVRGSLLGQAKPNDNLGAGPRIALRPDLSPECFDQLPTDRQPQACPTVLAGGRGADLTEL